MSEETQRELRLFFFVYCLIACVLGDCTEISGGSVYSHLNVTTMMSVGAQKRIG